MLKGFVSRIALIASWLGVFAAPAHAANFGAFNQAYTRDVVTPGLPSVLPPLPGLLWPGSGAQLASKAMPAIAMKLGALCKVDFG